MPLVWLTWLKFFALQASPEETVRVQIVGLGTPEEVAGADGRLLIGFDLKKDPQRLHAAGDPVDPVREAARRIVRIMLTLWNASVT